MTAFFKFFNFNPYFIKSEKDVIFLIFTESTLLASRFGMIG